MTCQANRGPAVVYKFGGTSLGTTGKILRVAQQLARKAQDNPAMVVVVSAMAGSTNQLAQWARQVHPDQGSLDERDVVLSSGEQVTAGLMALALRAQGLKAKSFLGWQMPLITDNSFSYAQVMDVPSASLSDALGQGIIPVVAGFQGVTTQGSITTLGRGGSDTTAVVLASTLQAQACWIFTDVDGVYAADPRIIPHARHYRTLSYEDMISFSTYGAKVLHPDAAQWALQHNVTVHVASTFQENSVGTSLAKDVAPVYGVAHRAIDVWQMDDISPDRADFLQKACHHAGVGILDWHASVRSLQLMTFAEDAGRLKGLLPHAVPEEKSLVSILGAVPHNTALYQTARKSIVCAQEQGDLHVDKVLDLPRALGVLIPRHQAVHAVATLYTNLTDAGFMA